MATTMDRPFPVYFETTGTPNRLEVMIDFQAPVNDDAKQGMLEVMTTFAKLGAIGGLAGHNYDPGQTSLTLETSQIMSQGSHWVFQNVRIDPVSVFILLNMIHYIHMEDAPLTMVRIAWPAVSQLKDPMAIQFPERWPHLSFPVDIGNLLDDIDVDIKFNEPQENDVIQRIVETMSVWLLATHRGVYADDAFDPSESAVFLGPDVMDVSPDRIIWFIEIMRCNDSALDGLLNVLEWVHQRVARISRVEMGP
jgi:hypothetical protein